MENNRLIAEFMGLRTNSYGDYNIDKDVMGFDMIVCSLADTKYHTSWDWLMPVVREVIIRYQVDEGIEIDYDELQHRVMDNDIERAYEEVVEFIKQYNNE